MSGDYLVCAIAGIGDAVMALPMLRVLRQARPTARIAVLASPINAALFKDQPVLDEVIVFPQPPSLRRLIGLARGLRRRGFTAAIGAIPSDLLSLSLLLKLSGIPRRVKQRLAPGQEDQGWELWFTDLLASAPDRHKTSANLDLLIPVGIRMTDLSRQRMQELVRLTIREDVLRNVCARFPRSPHRRLRTGMHPGCQKGWEFKRWNPARFAEVADRLIEENDAEVLWFGDSSEEALVREITSRMRNPSLSVAGSLGICDAAALISTCDLFISNDSGPMHIAAATGVKTIALFNSGNPRANPARTGPIGNGAIILKKPDLQDITVEDVMQAANEAVTRGSPPVPGACPR